MNKIAGFWIRTLSRLIDLIILVGITIGIAAAVLAKEPRWHFGSAWTFYCWICSQIFFTLFLFFFIPLTFKKTIGQFLCRIKVDTDGVFWKSYIKREVVFGGFWIFVSLTLMIVINHTLANHYLFIAGNSGDKDWIIVDGAYKQILDPKTNTMVNVEFKWSDWESARRSFMTAISGILIMFQAICLITTLVRKDKKGIHDMFANTNMVWTNKFYEVTAKIEEVKTYKPSSVKNNTVEWVIKEN